MCESHWLLRACTGIVEMSRFHQLFAGNTEQFPTRGTVEVAAVAGPGIAEPAGSSAARRSPVRTSRIRDI